MDFTRKGVGLEERLASYGLAAALAALGGALPAGAAIVHHDPAHVTTPLNGFLAFNMRTGAVSTSSPVDMHFRINWSSLTFAPYSGYLQRAVLHPVGPDGDAVFGSLPYVHKVNSYVGTNLVWTVGGTMAYRVPALYGSDRRGPWASYPSSEGFLGLRFKIDGNTHYGWAYARINTDITATLFDFAYESCPGERIAVGVTSGGSVCDADVDPVPEPHSAVLMAIGASGIVALRRKRRKARKR